MGASSGKVDAAPKQQPQPQAPQAPPPQAAVVEPSEDAPDAEMIGNAGWTILHTTAAAYPANPSVQQQKRMWEFVNAWSHVYPCTHCATHMRVSVKEDPPAVGSKDDFLLWTCRLHNGVNRRLEKDEFPCDTQQLLARWHPTYPEIEGTDQPGGFGDLPPFSVSKHGRQTQPASAGPAAAQGSAAGARAGAGGGDPDLQSLMDMKCTAFCPKDAK